MYYIPIECGKEPETVRCNSIRVTYSSFFCCSIARYYADLEYIMIRRHYRYIQVVLYYTSGVTEVLNDVIDLETFDYNLI